MRPWEVLDISMICAVKEVVVAVVAVPRSPFSLHSLQRPRMFSTSFSDEGACITYVFNRTSSLKVALIGQFRVDITI